MLKRFLLIAALILSSTATLMPASQAQQSVTATQQKSFTEGYFRNDSCIGYNQCREVALTLYPNYSGVQRAVPPNGAYSNYKPCCNATAPEVGDIKYIYIPLDKKCTIDQSDIRYPGEGYYGRLVTRSKPLNGYYFVQFARPQNIFSVWACYAV